MSSVTARASRLSVLLVLGTTSPLSAQERITPPDTASEVTVVGRQRASPLDHIDQYDPADIARIQALTAKELLDAFSIDSSTKVLVLINGRKVPINLSQFPAGLIDHIEVNRDGGMPDDGPRADGPVLNIILKPSYTALDLDLGRQASEAGGGARTQQAVVGGYRRDQLSLTGMAIHYDQADLRAAARSFSRQQDRRAQGGDDLRAAWSTTLAVQAVTGMLNGLTDPNGNPVATAFLRDPTSAADLSPSDFTPGPLGRLSAEGLTHFNTSRFLDLISPATSNIAGLQFTYPLTNRTSFSVNYSFNEASGKTHAPPPTTPASPETLVPAAFNPFAQDIEVGLLHLGFGPITQSSRSTDHNLDAALNGSVNDKWTWTLSASSARGKAQQHSRDLDPDKFSGALAAADPDQRFDPFASTSPGSANAALYPQLTRELATRNLANRWSVGAETRGVIAERTIGPVWLTATLGTDSTQLRFATNFSGDFTATTSTTRTSRAGAELQVPLFKFSNSSLPATASLRGDLTRYHQSATLDVPTILTDRSVQSTLEIPWISPEQGWRGANNLISRLTLGHSRQNAGGDGNNVGASLSWAPIESLTFDLNAAHAKAGSTIAPYPTTSLYNQTFQDPLRASAFVDGVDVISRNPGALGGSTGRGVSLAATLNPVAMPSLQLTAAYTDQRQANPTHTLTAQDIIDNETVLPGRVLRDSPTAQDIALRQPGRIVSVDTTPFTGGTSRGRSMNLTLQYRQATLPIGSLMVLLNADRRLSNRNELIPGVPLISTSNSETPPDWTVSGNLYWQRKQWNGTINTTHIGPGLHNGDRYARYSQVDAQLGYQFRNTLWGSFAKGFLVSLGVSNLFDTEPPRVDTLTGFRNSSPLGRAYELTIRVPLVGDGATGE